MQILEVTSPQQAKQFLTLAAKLYKGSKHWVRPLDKDIEEVFDPKKNKFFRHGECTRWILLKDGKCVGRIAAFINNKTKKEKNSQGQELLVGGMGFFESIDNKEVAFALFDHAKKWLQEKDCNVMEGPINFGERDNWWGLLAEGHDKDPNYKMPYTHKYYLNFFEEYGFEIYFRQLTFGRDVVSPLDPIYEAKAERIKRDPNFSFAYIDQKKIDKFTEDFRQVYNEAWANHPGVKGMTTLQAKTVMKSIKPIMDPKVMYFAYYEDRPIGFFIILPEVNEVFKKINGKMNWLGYLIFAYYKFFNQFTKIVGRGFGIVPEFQNKGVEGAIIHFSKETVQNKIKRKYNQFEMNWIGDFNKPMVKLCGNIGDIVKVHHTYRKMLDDQLIFERCKDVN